MWHCQKCGEELDDAFDECWKCGAASAAWADPEEGKIEALGVAADGPGRSPRERSLISLLVGERIIKELAGGELILTTHRVRHSSTRLGSEDFVSIMLDQIASCGTCRRSKPLLLAIAALSALLGLSWARNGTGAASISSLILAGGLALAFFLTVRQVLEFASAGATIRVNTAVLNRQEIEAFIHLVEKAKDERYKSTVGLEGHGRKGRA